MNRSSAQARLADIARQAAGCTRCPLFQHATQTVFGEGPADADLVMIGEQPGDQEDRQGHPFVGPAGRVLDKALAQAGIDRDRVYVTNAVKHFKNEPRGKRRLHKHPNRFEIEACRWWLDRELALIEPRFTVALGAVAAAALMGRAVVLARSRGRLLRWPDGRAGFATIHPSAVLRMPDDAARHAAFAGLLADFQTIAAAMRA